jgi:hypothetical protein
MKRRIAERTAGVCAGKTVFPKASQGSLVFSQTFSYISGETNVCLVLV